MKRYFVQQTVALLATFFIASGWGIAQPDYKTQFEFNETAPAAVRQKMQDNVYAVFARIHEDYSKDNPGLSILKENATDDAIAQLQALWTTSHFYCAETFIIARVLKSANGYQVRNIPVFFKEGDSPEEQIQDIVLEFTRNGVLNDVFMSIPLNQYFSILETRDTVVDLRHRQLILGFVDNFKTAYNKKDTVYLNKVFSKDALIITGKEISPKGDGKNPEGVKVEYVVQSKQQYIEKLKVIFRNNKYLKVNFSDIEVLRHPDKTNYYGITLRQEWNSSGYSDVGWLFLMIQFRENDDPLIWVRTWQPISVNRNKVFGLDDFNLDR